MKTTSQLNMSAAQCGNPTKTYLSPLRPLTRLALAMVVFLVICASVFAQSGNVGIGTSTPLKKLDVNGGARIDGTTLVVDEGNDRVGIGTATPTKKLEVNGAVRFNGNSFVIDEESGWVGIGTSSPQARLHVEGTIEVDQRIEANDGGGIEFATDDGIIRMKVEDDGDIGIGTTQPNKKLHVVGEGRFESTSGGNQVIIGGLSGVCEVEFQEGTSYAGAIGYDIANDRMYINHAGNVFFKGGNLGLGIDPARKIDVLGGAYCSGTNWINASSQALKENFLVLDNKWVLERIVAMPVTQWNYLSEGESVKHIGPMAEDFYATFGLGDSDAAISTVDIAGVSLAAIQALHAENIALAKENDQLREMLIQLTQRVETLELAREKSK